jgi:hypothetical protein
MDKLEKFIESKRDIFDDHEPSPGHFDRFREKLGMQPETEPREKSRFYFIRVAAVIIVLLTVSVFLFDFAIRWIPGFGGNTASAGELPPDLQEAVSYYNETANTHLGRIQKLACCGQDSHKLYSIASGELTALDANTRELTQTLKEHPDDRVKAALIRNQQMKETIMKNMIRQMSNAKIQQHP